MSTRRIFLRNAALAMVGVGAAPVWLTRALAGAQAPARRKKILVAILQRGAADGLNIVVPHAEKQYYAVRPAIAVPRDAVIDLDGFFGLHPSLAPLTAVWRGLSAIVHAAGSPDPALAFRCAGRHGIGHAGAESDQRRMAEPGAGGGAWCGVSAAGAVYGASAAARFVARQAQSRWRVCRFSGAQ
jgi:hypothetical protein